LTLALAIPGGGVLQMFFNRNTERRCEMKTYFPHNRENVMSFFDWSCLDYQDRLMKLYHAPYSVEGFDHRAAVLASYLMMYRPTTDLSSPDLDTSAGIQ